MKYNKFSVMTQIYTAVMSYINNQSYDNFLVLMQELKNIEKTIERDCRVIHG